jgi:CTD kinase subunit gamma
MQDPFEVRMRFTALLRNLNASQTAAVKAAQLALKHKDMHEDLHSCILEQLSEDDGNVNSRANIMCFVEVFLEAARDGGQQALIQMMHRDLAEIVQLVTRCEENGSNINAPLVRLVRLDPWCAGSVCCCWRFILTATGPPQHARQRAYPD